MSAQQDKTADVPAALWAVGRTADSSRVALKLNGDLPVILHIEEARALASALAREADTVARLRDKRGGR